MWVAKARLSHLLIVSMPLLIVPSLAQALVPGMPNPILLVAVTGIFLVAWASRKKEHEVSQLSPFAGRSRLVVDELSVYTVFWRSVWSLEFSIGSRRDPWGDWTHRWRQGGFICAFERKGNPKSGFDHSGRRAHRWAFPGRKGSFGPDHSQWSCPSFCWRYSP